MPSKQQKRKGNRREANRRYYQKNKLSLNTKSQIYRTEYNRTHRQELKAKSQRYNRAHRQELKVRSQEYNRAHRQELKVQSQEYNRAHRQELKAKAYKYNRAHKQKLLAYYKQYYKINSTHIKTAQRHYYSVHKDTKIAAVRKYQLRNARKILKWARKYYAEHRARIGADRRRWYELTEPKPLTKQRWHLAGSLLKMVRAINKITISSEDDLGEGSHCVHGEPYYYDTSYIHGDIRSVICVEVNSQSSKQSFKDQHEKTALKMTAATSTSSIPATRLVNKVLQIRKDLAGTLLKVVRINNKKQSDLSEDSHCEPYHYYESSCVHNRPSICIDEHGKYRLLDGAVEHVVPRSWKCNDMCKLSDSSCIIEFKSTLNESMQKIRKALDVCDECPNSKYAKVFIVPANEPDSNVVHYNSVELKGHSLICHIGSDCKSKLRILRAASTHYSVLRSFLRCVYSALNSHKNIASLDEALHHGDFNSLMRDFEVTFDDLFSNEVNQSHELEGSFAKCVLRRPDLEKHLQIEHAKVMAKYKKELEDYPQNPCCSCNMLFCLKQGSKITFSTELGNMWPDLKHSSLRMTLMLQIRLFICTYCRSYLRSNEMPPRCVLNGLQTSPIPKELSVLDELSKQFIQ